MALSIVILTPDEQFLQFLDPELCTLVETHEQGGLRRLDFTYMFQDLHNDKQLFKIGNKVWVSGDTNLTDTLYVINTPVETDVYQNNSFHCTIEEVLVELNYTTIVTQNEVTSNNGFHITTTNGQQAVKIDWNALHFWFGKYFNIGVVQQCLNEAHNKIVFTGTMTRMALLRYIEEETGNVFVTRYEKDCLNNTIHRYLDFLNPLDISKDWVLQLEYDFSSTSTTGIGVFDEDGNPTTDTYDDVETEDDIVLFDEGLPYANIDPSKVQFQITNSQGYILNSDGNLFEDNEDTALIWEPSEVGFSSDTPYCVIQLSMNHGVLGMICGAKTFVVTGNDVAGVVPDSYVNISGDAEVINDCWLPDDSYFEIFDTEAKMTLYKVQINRAIGTVHEEILDFGFNLENVIFETDEEDTFNAISPVLTLDDNELLTKNDMSTLIGWWKDLSISKGDIIPMIIEKINVSAPSSPYTLAHAQESLGTRSPSNYYLRPFHPQDNVDSSTPSNSTWEFWRATAYWRAPFNKNAGETYVRVDEIPFLEYDTIYTRPDTRDDIVVNTPKIGTVETSAESSYAIYNDVALKLKDKMEREFTITVDVANLRKGQFNQYQLHDKVYVKLPDYTELLTARVTKTSKEAHDVAKNTIELSNYHSNNVKVEPFETVILANNTSFKYPQSKQYSIRLENLEYDSEDEWSIQYPANKLVSFTLYNVDNNNRTLTKYTWNRVTDAYGYAKINLNLDPGNYELDIIFNGDEEYNSSSMTVQVNVSGVKLVPNLVDTKKARPSDYHTQKQKTTKKTSANKNKTVKTKRYYSKYGVSPDEKYLVAVGRASAGGELAKYGYKWYKTVFKRKCPCCGSKELYWNIFWTGNEYASNGKNPAIGRYKGGSVEGEITCKKCDADFSIFGKSKENRAGYCQKSLTVYKKPVKSNKSEAYTVKKGKLYYDTVEKTVKEKKVTSEKTRTSSYTINKNVKELALKIVGDSKGLAAAKKIAAWCGNRNNLDYDNYGNFLRSPKTVMNRKAANCCDSTRFMFTLMSAAGCEETLKLEYVHTKNGQWGHIFGKITTRSTGKWRYVDPVLKSRAPWGNHLNNPKYGSLPGTLHSFGGPDVPNIWWS